jgi:PTH2 family peptidyl-tRNA hydrolase
MTVKMVIVVRTDLNMRKGKMSAQVGHAASLFVARQIQQHMSEVSRASSRKHRSFGVTLSDEQFEWFMDGTTKIVVGVSSEAALIDLMNEGRKRGLTVNSVTDAGRTEFGGVPTLTCAAIGPNDVSEIDKLTGGLKLQ